MRHFRENADHFVRKHHKTQKPGKSCCERRTVDGSAGSPRKATLHSRRGWRATATPKNETSPASPRAQSGFSPRSFLLPPDFFREPARNTAHTTRQWLRPSSKQQPPPHHARPLLQRLLRLLRRRRLTVRPGLAVLDCELQNLFLVLQLFVCVVVVLFRPMPIGCQTEHKH